MDNKTHLGIFTAALFLLFGIFNTPVLAHEKEKILISETTILKGLRGGALFPYIDTTPNKIVRAHIALTDSTAVCGQGGTQPDNISLLVGVAGGELVAPTLENTGIGDIKQCVFHLSIEAGKDSIPSEITDIVVINNSPAPLSGFNTITVSATVEENDEDQHHHDDTQ
ncbi:hypothetical protein Nhal_1692 [Nitrosococcus halophilus Nc 4]|uniref:Uncharacterized protein n=1 Tax=Nitrosococcus halophilus (strain Nc4) TaxID=472759 RepID=D5C2G1_NITHN|nr:hypothetical protein [Nitrosococcus halophilus]ADE14820.1 hypothetical protein Nhal_1692 [Nitrosococcus halophilus Nc 4]